MEDIRRNLQKALEAASAVNDPFLGEGDVGGFRRASMLWPGENWTEIESVSTVAEGPRRFEEYLFRPAEPAGPALPVGFLFDQAPQGVCVHVYSDHHLVADRAPILRPVDGIHPWRDERDVLFRYFRALNENRLEDVLDLFEEDGYFRHSNNETFRGRTELRADFSKMMGATGIRIRYCQFTDDGRTCAVECYMPSGRPAVAVYERGRPGKLRAVRIYL